MLQEEGRPIAETLKEITFQASNRWLQKWKKHHNICEMIVVGEKGEVKEETESW